MERIVLKVRPGPSRLARGIGRIGDHGTPRASVLVGIWRDGPAWRGLRVLPCNNASAPGVAS